MMTIITSFCTTTFAQNESKCFELGAFAGASLNSYTGDDFQDADMKLGFNAGITGKYYFYKNFFGELSLGIATKGYKQDVSASSGQYWDYDGVNYDSDIKENMTTYNLDIPLYVGYRFSIGRNSHFSVKIGPYITYALSGQLKTSGYVITYPDIHSSEKEYTRETKKIGDMEGFNKFSCGAACGISYYYKNYGITVSYQRGLTEINKDKDIYEQNISLILGYSF